ncbi:MAG: nickel-responsive transcriptional regulator NikR [Zwartia sp.]|jgi:CopG family nickel-responsive transcriptional regulator
MERITISLDESLAQEFDALISAKSYKNRSEAMRDILREYVETNRIAQARAPDCVANVSYVYNHHEREMAKRLNDIQHAHHDLTIASMHAHLDHEFCVETLLLKGPTKQVQSYAQEVLAERGVRHGVINVIPVDLAVRQHKHTKGHVHLKPKT